MSKIGSVFLAESDRGHLMSDRTPIPDDLVARVLYASDRQCCICRDGNTRIQIHHIDGDPSNNSFENLTVICLDHHSQAHSKEAFVRNLTPAVIREYNQSWRALVKLRLDPKGDPEGLIEYKSEVLLELSLNCHSWKIHYMALYPGGFMDVDGKRFIDVWDMMMEVASHPYSEQEWKRYLPLFVDGINRLLNKFDRALTLYPEILPVPFKTMLIRARRRLETEQGAYLSWPSLLKKISISEGFFKQQFTEATQVVRDVAREADRLRKSTTGVT